MIELDPFLRGMVMVPRFSTSPPATFHRAWQLPSVLCWLLVAGTAPLLGAESHLKNGVVIEGKPIPIQGLTRAEIEREQGSTNRHYPILMIHAGMKRYFVPGRQVDNIDHAGGVINLEEFEIDQKLGARRQMLSALGGLKIDQDFDEFGRRTVSFSTSRGQKHVVQGITRLNPRYATVTAMTDVDWEHGLATTSLAEDTLDAILRNTIDPQNPQERMGVAVFYVQAGLYVRAGKELDSIIRDFPELKQTAEEVITELRSVQANRLLSDLRERRDAGQHRLAALALKEFPTQQMSAAVLKDVRDLGSELETYRNQFDRAHYLLASLQQAVKDEAKRKTLESMRSVLRDQLDTVGLNRLDAFLKLEADGSLSPEQKLALAYSGWMLGSAHAVTDLDQTLRYWQARHLVRECLAAREANTQRELLSQLHNLEGISPQVVAWMLVWLPPLLETPGIQAGVAHKIEVQDADPKTPVAYHVLLPHEYSPNRAYPLIVALHPAEQPAAAELLWWGGTKDEPGQSQRHGYIVIAPEYADEKLTEYDYDARSHYVTLKAIRDARKRFHVDSDRVFLSGHGMGGDATFDIAMSHPDTFAGAIPIAGLSRHYCKWYWRNAKDVPWYLVSGELVRNSLNDPDHSAVLGRMLRYGHEFDLIYAEYVGRGYESYYEEIHQIFDWMARHERAKGVKEVEATVLRPGDNRFYWIVAEQLPPNVLQATVIGNDNGQRARVRPMTLEASILDGSDDHTTINVASGAKTHVIELSPDLVDYNKRVWVRCRGMRQFNDFPQPDIETMLNDFREQADRQKIIWTKIIVE